MIKKAASFLTAVLIFFITANIPVSNADGGPDLTIETIEIDQNSIPDNRMVKVKVNMNNNPGINYIAFNFQFDKRLRMDLMVFCEKEVDEISTWGGSIYNEAENIAVADAVFDPESWYYENGDFLSLCFFLPEDCHAGDFYPINFVEGDDLRSTMYAAEDGDHYKNESMGTLISGGIRITGSDPAPEIPVQQPEPPAVNVPEPQEPAQPEQPQIPASPETPPETQPDETAAVLETTAEVTTTDVSVTSAASAASVTSTETVSQTTAGTTTVITSSETETTTDISVLNTNNEIKEENKKGISVLIIVLTAAAAVLITTIFMIKRSNSNE